MTPESGPLLILLKGRSRFAPKGKGQQDQDDHFVPVTFSYKYKLTARDSDNWRAAQRNMSDINRGQLDLSKLTPGQLETLAKIAYSNRLQTLTPYFFLSWMDAVCMGLSAVVFVEWWNKARPTERKWSRYLMYWTMLAIVAYTGMYQTYTVLWFAADFGRYAQWLKVDWVKPSTMLGFAVRMPTMAFFTHRAFVLVHRQIWVICVSAPLILATAVCPIAQCIIFNTIPTPPLMKVIWKMSACAEITCDVILTGTIATQLYRSKTGWSSTDRIISRLLVTLAETMTPPTCISLVLLISLYLFPDTSYTALILIYPKVAFLCIAITLLSRVSLAEMRANGPAKMQGISASGATTGDMALSEGAVLYGEDKGELVHGDVEKVLSVNTSRTAVGAMGTTTAFSAALTESTIEPEPERRGP